MIAGKKTYILIAAGGAVLGLLFSIMAYRTFFMSNISGEGSYLYIPHNAGYNQLSDSLEKSGAVRSMRCFKRAAGFEGLENVIKPGMYHLRPGMSNHQIIRILKHGWQTPVRITLSGNIRNMEKLASLLSRKIESDSTQILTILKDSSLIDSLGFTPLTFPSLFLLDTYEVYWTITPKELLLRFKREYDKFWNKERLEKAVNIGLTPIEVSTLASIVSEESNLKAEQHVIAGVYINRLRKKMPLQADPTIKFILNDPSVKRILNRHLSINSPYNTYKHAGLPPGPIVIPQKSTIDAVLDYKKHNYIYFCAKPTLDGSHNFAVTLAEHNKNARAYQRAISRL